MQPNKLEEIFPKMGDRIAVQNYCRTHLNPRKQSLIERLKNKMSKNNKKEGSSSAKQVKTRKKPTRLVEIGWLCNTDGSRYTQVRKLQGGGTRQIEVDRDAKVGSILHEALMRFFPDGKSPKGEITDFEYKLLDFKQHDIKDELSVDDYFQITGLTKIRFYLATKKRLPDSPTSKRTKVSYNISVSDEVDHSGTDDDDQVPLDDHPSHYPNTTQMCGHEHEDWGNSDRTETTFNDGSTEFSILVNSILDDFESQVPDRSNQPCEIDIPTLPANDNEPARPESLADILRQISEDIDVNKNNHFNIYREDIFGCCVRAMNRKSFSPHYKISVKFSDIEGNSEGAVDEGGPRREMFRLVLQWIKESSLFCGQDKKHVTLSGKGLQEKQYFEAGRLIALSLIHGGPAPHFFSDSLFAILTGDECVPTVDDMPDEIKIQLLKFQECKELIELQNVMLDTDIFTIAGFPFVISFYDKEKILEGTLKFYGTNRVGAAIDQLIDGLKICNLHHHIVNFPHLFKEAFCSFPAKLTAELLENIFSISYSEAGSNRRNVENRVISFFRDYVLECEEESGTTSLEDILIFATGADCVPPLGFTTKPQLLFLNDSTSRFPTANTCALQLNLPTVHASYEDFKDNMNFAINNCKEFGFA